MIATQGNIVANSQECHKIEPGGGSWTKKKNEDKNSRKQGQGISEDDDDGWEMIAIRDKN